MPGCTCEFFWNFLRLGICFLCIFYNRFICTWGPKHHLPNNRSHLSLATLSFTKQSHASAWTEQGGHKITYRKLTLFLTPKKSNMFLLFLLMTQLVKNVASMSIASCNSRMVDQKIMSHGMKTQSIHSIGFPFYLTTSENSSMKFIDRKSVV